jgi:hypothetical protein
MHRTQVAETAHRLDRRRAGGEVAYAVPLSKDIILK